MSRLKRAPARSVSAAALFDPRLWSLNIGKRLGRTVTGVLLLTSNSPSLARRGVKIRRFSRNPIEKLRHFRMLLQPGGSSAAPGEFGIAEMGVDRAVTDRMKRHNIPSPTALGHRMMPFDPPSQRAFAQPAAHRIVSFTHCPGGLSRHDWKSRTLIRKLSKFQPYCSIKI